MELNKKNIKTLLGMAAAIVLFAWALQNTSRLGELVRYLLGLFSPFLLGMSIAFILSVPLRAIERRLFAHAVDANGRRKGWVRPVSILITLALVAGVLCVVMFLIIPEIAGSISTLSAAFPAFLGNMQRWAVELSATLPEIGAWLEGLEINWQQLASSVFQFLQNGAGDLLGGAVGVAGAVFSGIVTFFLGFVFSFYILMQKERLARQARQICYAFLPEEKADFAVRVGRMANSTFSSFLSGQCIEAVILGCLFFIAMSIFRLPYAMMVSVLISITSLVPVFGAFIGCFVGTFLILIINPMQALGFLILFLVLQQIEGNLIYPKVVGGSVGLPSIWVLMAVTIGGSTMGLIGMLIFIPLTSVCYSLFREMVYRRLSRKHLPEQKIR